MNVIEKPKIVVFYPHWLRPDQLGLITKNPKGEHD
jgi:hypothetical protein